MISKLRKAMPFFLTLTAVCVGAVAFTSCSNDDANFALRSDDQLHFSYAAGEKDFAVCTDGDWTITTDAAWLSFDVTSGTGDGITRQTVKVFSARNTSVARFDSFILHAAGRALAVYCTQDEGAPLTFGSGKLTGSLQVGKTADLVLSIPYTYGYKGQNITLHTVLSGAGAEGLSVNDTTVELESEKGDIALPVNGNPLSSGPVVFKVTANDAEVSPLVVQASVLSKVILEQHFDLMLWGGEVINYQPGVKGGFMDGDGGKVIDANVAVAACKAFTDGSNDLILTMAESYRQLRGFSGGAGARIYEHPGYVKIGTAKLTGSTTTPALSELSNGITDIKVTCRVAQYLTESGGTLTISVLNGGEPSIKTYEYKNAGKKNGCTWENLSFTVIGVTPQAQISWSTQGNKRFCIDDIVISEGK